LLGPAGTGKSSLTTQFALAAAARGERSILFLFDELEGTFRERTAGLGMDITAPLAEGLVRLVQVDPAELTPGEFAEMVCNEVAREGVRLVVIDTLNGYLASMPSEKLLLVQLHELLAHLGQQGVSTIMILAQHGLVNGPGDVAVDSSYLADNVLLLRYFEAEGEIRQALSVVKKRTGTHERTIRELRLTDKGILIGEPLRNYQGVLTGNPVRVAAGMHGREADEPGI
jgi:circadian clock protein KaiC